MLNLNNITILLISIMFLWYNTNRNSTTSSSPIVPNNWVSDTDRIELERLDKRLVDVLDILFKEYYTYQDSYQDPPGSLLDRIERRLYVFPLLTVGKDNDTVDSIITHIVERLRNHKQMQSKPDTVYS